MLRGYQPIDFMRYWGGDERGNAIGSDFPIVSDCNSNTPPLEQRLPYYNVKVHPL